MFKGLGEKETGSSFVVLWCEWTWDMEMVERARRTAAVCMCERGYDGIG